MISVTSPHCAISCIASANASPRPIRTISGGSALITARGVTFRSRATSSITAPGFCAICALRSARLVLNMIGSLDRATSSAAGSGRSARFALALDHLEPLEFGVTEIEAFAGLVVGTGMGAAELFRPGPGLERRLVDPGGVRRIQRVIIRHRTLQQVKLDETGHAAEIGFPGRPDGFESLFRADLHLKPVHRDKHINSLLLVIVAGGDPRWLAQAK